MSYTRKETYTYFLISVNTLWRLKGVRLLSILDIQQNQARDCRIDTLPLYETGHLEYH